MQMTFGMIDHTANSQLPTANCQQLSVLPDKAEGSACGKRLCWAKGTLEAPVMKQQGPRQRRLTRDSRRSAVEIQAAAIQNPSALFRRVMAIGALGILSFGGGSGSRPEGAFGGGGI
jgi:hypothetical protein